MGHLCALVFAHHGLEAPREIVPWLVKKTLVLFGWRPLVLRATRLGTIALYLVIRLVLNHPYTVNPGNMLFLFGCIGWCSFQPYCLAAAYSPWCDTWT